MLNGFLLGIIVMAELVASGYFLKFWRRTRDPLFLAFAVSFGVEAVNRTAFLSVEDAAAENPWLFGVRLFCYLIILGAILHKNLRRTPPTTR